MRIASRSLKPARLCICPRSWGPSPRPWQRSKICVQPAVVTGPCNMQAVLKSRASTRIAFCQTFSHARPQSQGSKRAISLKAAQAEQSVTSLSSIELDDPNPPLAYEVLQGPLVRWTRPGSGASPPTAVLVHGILGSRRNMQSFARLLLEGFPSWQVLLVDLRCHGESSALSEPRPGPHTVHTAASDVIALLNNLKLFPHTLIGHSFGGKVVMGMVQQFGMRLPRPVQVWVLDTPPGEVRALDEPPVLDQPAKLIQCLRSMPLPITSRSQVVNTLLREGFSTTISNWAATSVRPMSGVLGTSSSALTWTFDLDGIQELYQSFEAADLFPLLEQPPQGLKLDFVKAGRSTFRWNREDEERIKANGHRVHVLENAGHWVHTDNPLGLFDLMARSFGKVDLQQQRRP